MPTTRDHDLPQDSPPRPDTAPGAEPEAVPGTAGAEAAETGRPPETAGTAEAETAGAETAGAETAGAADGAADGAAQGGFRVRLENFEGPFDLLLGLISKHKLDVTEIALSRVTDEFIAHIRAMGPDWDLDQATEFLVVAATLLDLKAARLLPAAEVEDEEDLALLEARDLLFARLLQYRAYKQVAAVFAERWAAEQRQRPRTVSLEPHHAALLPEVVISIGPERFARLAAKAMTPKPRPVVYVDHIHTPPVSVREQAALVVELLRAAGGMSFTALVEDAGDTLTVVARFLALLELYRERVLAFEQPEALGELQVVWIGEDGREVEVTDEFDRRPEQSEDDSGGRRSSTRSGDR